MKHTCVNDLTMNSSHYLLLSGGYVSNSLAIMTDAVHMLADVVGILFSLLALWLSTKPPTKRFTFGLHRLGEIKRRLRTSLLRFLFLSTSVVCDANGCMRFCCKFITFRKESDCSAVLETDSSYFCCLCYHQS